MVEPLTATVAWRWRFQPPHPWEPLQKRLTQSSVRGLFNYDDNQEKLITKLNSFILIFISSQRLLDPKQ
jgi:hypothetical protein